MIYANQIKLIKKGIKVNKEFFKLMYNCGFDEESKWFDKLDCNVSWRRQKDDSQTLENFVKGINKKAHIVLQLASPNPFEIRYSVSFRKEGIKKLAWVICPYNDDNFKKVGELYLKAFGSVLENEPVPDGLVEYYKARVEMGY